MITKLTAIGDRPALVLDPELLALLGVGEDTLLEVHTDGRQLIVEPARPGSPGERALAAAEQLMDAHAETFRKLAQ